MRRWIIVAAAFALLSYSRAEDVSGTIRIWGSNQMLNLVNRWANQFRADHPLVRFEPKLMGTETGMAGLYTGVADMVVIGRRATPKELMAFEWVFKYKPLEIAIVTGSLNAPGKSPALVVFVHRDNPISKLTFAQLDAIFSCERLRGHSAIENWGQLGLTGDWSDKKIHAYGFDSEMGSASFFKAVVMNGSGKWNWPQLREFKDPGRILEALARDQAGIAVSNLCSESPPVKPLALSREPNEQFYEATKENIVAQKYPLTRLAYAYVNHPPGKPIPALLRQFLEYVLTNEGQQEAVEDGYLPLNAMSLEEQHAKLH